jgi:hypothetical protein
MERQPVLPKATAHDFAERWPPQAVYHGKNADTLDNRSRKGGYTHGTARRHPERH